MPDGDLKFQPDTMDPRALRTAFGKFATGVTIVTCQSEIGPLGMTANSFASVSLTPPLVLWSAARASERCHAFETANNFAIHVLAETQSAPCHAFARDGCDFDTVDWSYSERGVPLISGCLASFECEKYATYDGGDHSIIVGRVLTASINEGPPLVFSNGTFGQFKRTESG
ncbi:MAG: flavin reductase family protein [Pseudomonadota bacterium]